MDEFPQCRTCRRYLVSRREVEELHELRIRVSIMAARWAFACVFFWGLGLMTGLLI